MKTARLCRADVLTLKLTLKHYFSVPRPELTCQGAITRARKGTTVMAVETVHIVQA